MAQDVGIEALDNSAAVLRKVEELNALFSDSIVLIDKEIPSSVKLKIEVSDELLKSSEVAVVDCKTDEKDIVRLNICAVNLTNNNCKPDMPVTKRDLIACILKHHSEDKYLYLRWKTTGWRSFVCGGREGLSVEESGMQEIVEESGYKNVRFVKELDCEAFDMFYAPHKNVNRFVNVKCGVFQLIDDERDELSEKENELHECIWVSKSELKDALSITTNKFFWDVYQDNYFSLEGLKIYVEHKLKQ